MSTSALPPEGVPPAAEYPPHDNDNAFISSKLRCAEDACRRAYDTLCSGLPHGAEIHYAIDQCDRARMWIYQARDRLRLLRSDYDDEDAIDTPIVTEAPASDVFPEPDQADVKGGA